MQDYQSKEGISYIRKYHPNHLDNINLIKYRNLVSREKLKRQETLPIERFNRSSSQTTIKNKMPKLAQERYIPKKQVINQLSNQLKSIQQSIDSLSLRRKKKLPKYKQRVITEVQQSQPKSKIYREIIGQIKQMKNQMKAKQKQTYQAIQPSLKQSTNMRHSPNERVLFYGVDYIDNIKFKIKIKLSKTTYTLMAKNQTIKLLLEMSYAQYNNIHDHALKSNPCNIFKYLIIENNKLILNLYKERQRAKSFKTYLGYY